MTIFSLSSLTSLDPVFPVSAGALDGGGGWSWVGPHGVPRRGPQVEVPVGVGMQGYRVPQRRAFSASLRSCAQSRAWEGPRVRREVGLSLSGLGLPSDLCV